MINSNTGNQRKLRGLFIAAIIFIYAPIGIGAASAVTNGGGNLALFILTALSVTFVLSNMHFFLVRLLFTDYYRTNLGHIHDVSTITETKK